MGWLTRSAEPKVVVRKPVCMAGGPFEKKRRGRNGVLVQRRIGKTHYPDRRMKQRGGKETVQFEKDFTFVFFSFLNGE
jgi:hypothetical protein